MPDVRPEDMARVVKAENVPQALSLRDDEGWLRTVPEEEGINESQNREQGRKDTEEACS